jgi:hypothetical protein
LTQQEEDYAVERLKNVPSVASFLEISEELGRKMDVNVENDKTAENKSSKMTESELEAVVEDSVPFSEKDCNRESTKECGILNAGRKEANVDPLESGK